MLTIGLVTENYHTEVAEFLLELFSDNKQFNTIFYNSHDNYLNWEIFEKKFTNVTKKPAHMFLPDLNNNVCNKYFVITYENLFTLNALSYYKEQLIIICHNKRNIEECIQFNYQHITLTPFLLETCYNGNSMWMFPFLNNENDLQTMIDNFSRKRIQNRKKIKLLSIGAFDNENRDIEKIRGLLNNKDIELNIFLMTVSELVKKLVNEYNNIKVYEKISSKSILDFAKNMGIEYILYTPKAESEFVCSGKWSGCIAFGYTNDIPVILPKKIAEQNKLTGCISYDIEDKIYDKIKEYESRDIESNMKTLYDVKRLNYNRNNLITDILLKKYTQNFIYTNYGTLFLKDGISVTDISNTDYISINVLKYLYVDNKEINKKINNDIYILNYGSQLGVENLIINYMNINDYKRKMNIISIDDNLEFCKLQKYTNLINFYDNIKIFNNKIGKNDIQTQIETDIETITIDTLLKQVLKDNHDKQLIIHVNQNKSHEIQDILEGCIKTISQYKPIFVFDKSIDIKQCNNLLNYGYQYTLVYNRIVLTHLK